MAFEEQGQHSQNDASPDKKIIHVSKIDDLDPENMGGQLDGLAAADVAMS